MCIYIYSNIVFVHPTFKDSICFQTRSVSKSKFVPQLSNIVPSNSFESAKNCQGTSSSVISEAGKVEK